MSDREALKAKIEDDADKIASMEQAVSDAKQATRVVVDDLTHKLGLQSRLQSIYRQRLPWLHE